MLRWDPTLRGSGVGKAHSVATFEPSASSISFAESPASARIASPSPPRAGAGRPPGIGCADSRIGAVTVSKVPATGWSTEANTPVARACSTRSASESVRTGDQIRRRASRARSHSARVREA